MNIDWSCWNWYILVLVISRKLMYKKYLELICKCLLDDMYTELTCIIIPHGEITWSLNLR